MTPDGINIWLDELTQQILCAETKEGIVRRLADTYAQTPQYKAMLASIAIDPEEIKKRVMDRMVDEIIKIWKEKEWDTSY